MFRNLIGEKVNILTSTRGDYVLEYFGTIISENEESVELSNVDISIMMLNFQKGIFGGNINKYKEDVEKVVINKKYIISCDK
jgi:hypothetical protein